MRRFVLTLVLLIATLGFTVSNTPPAEAATQYKFYHLKISERANMLVYPTWRCTGSGGSFTRKGEWADIDVRSVWIPRGYSFWSFNSDAEGTRLAKAKDKARCFSFAGYPGNNFAGAFAEGNAFDWM